MGDACNPKAISHSKEPYTAPRLQGGAKRHSSQRKQGQGSSRKS